MAEMQKEALATARWTKMEKKKKRETGSEQIGTGEASYCRDD